MTCMRHSARSRKAGITYAIALCIGVSLCDVALDAAPKLPAPVPTPVDLYSIRAPFKDSEIVATASPSFGGAIYSLTWNGMEFLSSADFGSELQSSVYLNGFGEKCNPIEVGSYHDSIPSSVTSMRVDHNGKVLSTSSLMRYAYQTRRDCGNDPVHFRKVVTLGYAGIPNVIEHDVVYSLPKDYNHDLSKWPAYNHATFMALSANLPLANFPKQYYYDPRTKILSSIPDTQRNAGRNVPPIIATQDGQHALGVYSRGTPAIQKTNLIYTQWRSVEGDIEAVEPLNEWICRYNHHEPISAGDYRFKCYSVIGTLQDVQEGIDRLYALTAAPDVSFTSPQHGAYVSGIVTLTAKAGDEANIIAVIFKDGDQVIGAEVRSPPYTVFWNTSDVPDGSHRLYAIARNPGLKSTSTSVDVTVANRR